MYTMTVSLSLQRLQRVGFLSTGPAISPIWMMRVSASTNLVNPLTADTTIQANFDYVDYLLTVNTTGNGSVIKSPDQATYHYGDIVALTATPDDEGWVFKEWLGDVAEPLLQNTTVMIDSDKTVTAVFEEKNFTLHLAVSGEGSVTPSAGTHVYIEGQVVSLNAVPLDR